MFSRGSMKRFSVPSRHIFGANPQKYRMHKRRVDARNCRNETTLESLERVIEKHVCDFSIGGCKASNSPSQTARPMLRDRLRKEHERDNYMDSDSWNWRDGESHGISSKAGRFVSLNLF